MSLFRCSAILPIFHLLSQEGHAAVVSALLSDHHHYNDMEPADNDRLENSETKCASVNLADSDGTTPLLLAAEVMIVVY